MVLQQNKNAGANCPCIFYSAAESIFSIKMPILGTPQNRAFCGEEEAAGLNGSISPNRRKESLWPEGDERWGR